jgi:hypothetical protein
MFISANCYCQKISFDTIKNNRSYIKYELLSRHMLYSIKKNENDILNKYFEHPGTYNKVNLKQDLYGYINYFKTIPMLY